VKVNTPGELPGAWATLATTEAVLEKRVDFDMEMSVVAARGVDGSVVDFGVMENIHVNHILDVTLWPARVPPRVQAEARKIAHGVLEALDVVGVMCVELFLTRDGRVLVNELAPRPHNSGHLTIESHTSCQFEQQVRAVCGLPLGSTQPRTEAAAMANLLGDLWYTQGRHIVPDWTSALGDASIKLHLYGKTQPRPGRKMGHMTALASTADAAITAVRQARQRLTPAVRD
jgi:5-(carboxyamino)imidazole ribonucleotide synthase